MCFIPGHINLNGQVFSIKEMKLQRWITKGIWKFMIILNLWAVFGGKLKKFEGYDYYHQAFKPLVLRDLPGLAFPQWISAISASFTNIVGKSG